MRPVLLLGVLGGLGVGLGGAPFEAQGVAFVGAMLIFAALRMLSSRDPQHRERSALRACLAGLAIGFTANATTCAWLSDLLHSYAFMPWPIAWLVASLLFAIQALPFVAAALVFRVMVGVGLPRIVAWPLALVASASAVPMLFPWRLGISQMGFLPFVQLAELGGLPLLDFALALITACVVESWVAQSRRETIRLRMAFTLSAVSLFAGIALWGSLRIDEVREERASQPLLRVGIVQHNIDIPERMRPELWPSQMESTWSLTRELEARGVDVVMWPESAFPWSIDRSALARLPSDMALEEAAVNGPILFGAASFAPDLQRYNTVFLITRTRFLGHVDKTRLMPFSERIPVWGWLVFLHPFMGPGLSEGPREGGVLEIASGEAHATAGILNCYEDLMDDHVRSVARQAPDFLSNHTNDAWFGPTRAPVLHHFLARMRAIETRRDVVRTVNTGVSGHIGATGESLMTTEAWTTQARVADVRLMQGMTLWVWLGDWLTPLCFVWLFGVLWNQRGHATRRW